MWVGIDDTDGPSGGCTTFVLTELLRTARLHGVDLIREPRLVRLNPNIPWKTRGNAALSLRLGRGVGRRRAIGQIDHRPVWSFERGRSVQDRDRVEEALWQTVLATSARDAGTDPAMVVSDRLLPAELYRDAVRTVVPIDRVRALLGRRGARWRTSGSARGLVGAAASIAWPGRRVTWELIAYRSPGISGPRRVGVESVRAAQKRFPSLFLCTDDRTRRMMVAPHTPCPILFGLRSTDPTVLPRAARMIDSEPIGRWLVFRTNQGTGDHLRRTRSPALAEYGAGILTGTVGREPVTKAGGHVSFELLEADGTSVECRVFEPTKTLPAVARALRRGDRLDVWGGRAADPDFRVEGLVIRSARPRLVAGPPPRCPVCHRGTGSMGRARGFRCPSCHARLPPESRRARTTLSEFPPGTYHPTPSARRHLAPLGPE